MFQNPKLQVYEFESSKRNNLIFYGLASEDGEVGTGIQDFVKSFFLYQDCRRLVSRVKIILKQQLNMSRQGRINFGRFLWFVFGQVDIVRASRLHTGPDVSSSRIQRYIRWCWSIWHDKEIYPRVQLVWFTGARMPPSPGHLSGVLWQVIVVLGGLSKKNLKSSTQAGGPAHV